MMSWGVRIVSVHRQVSTPVIMRLGITGIAAAGVHSYAARNGTSPAHVNPNGKSGTGFRSR